MKAVVFRKYGPPDVLKLEEVKKPTTKANEVLIKIHAATVTAGDCELRRFRMPLWIWLPLRLYMGVLKPRIKILGQEFAGVIEDIGAGVTEFKVGDQVFGPTKMSLGAHAEYICLPANHVIVKKPASISFEEAATIPTGGLNALDFVRRANIQAGEEVLINGAGGAIGTYATQLAKSLGAKVTAVDSGEKLEMLRSIGANKVINYQEENFTENRETYDVIIDMVESSYSGCVGALKKNGRYIIGNPRPSRVIRAMWTKMTTGKRVVNAMAAYRKEDLFELRDRMAAGEIKAIIDRKFSLEEMAEAHRYVEAGLKKGHVVIAVV